MSTEAEQDEATRRQAAINEALATSDACWRMEQEVLQRQLDEWRSRAEYAERELSAAFDLPPSVGPTEGEAKRIVETLRRERDEARVELKKTEDDFQSVFDSRDEVIREREQYLEARNQHWGDLSRIAGICNASDGERPVKAVERLVKERDELLQRVETLRELADRASHEQGVAQRRMTEAQTVRDNATFRARRACQLLIEEVGADGPADVDEVAERAAALIRELRDQVSDLQAEAEESEHQMHLRVRAGYDKTIADCWRAKVAEVEAERDGAKAEAERMRDERDYWERRFEYADTHLSEAFNLSPMDNLPSGEAKRIVDLLRTERDEALAQVARREREHEALAHAEAERNLLKNHYSPEAAAKLRAELASARAEIEALKYPRAYLPPGEERSLALSAIMISQAETEIRALKAENERLQRLLDHATQPNPGTSVLVMLMNEASAARAETERLRAERDSFYAGQKGAIAEFSRREVHQRAYNAAFDREIERGKSPIEAADIAGKVAYWDEAEAKGEP
jgi:uncharacterized coiled-coil DUF342 family protein